MAKSKTINSAIIDVLKEHAMGLSSREIYDKIVERQLYSFKAKNPYSVVMSQLRKHCSAFNYPRQIGVKYFKLLPGNKYALID